jgi:hypothetical protein
MPDEPKGPASESAPEPAGEPKSAEVSTTKPAATTLPPVSVAKPDTGYTPAGVPTLGGVRDKIETRYGTALGATELAEETTEVRAASQRYEAVQKAAADKLEEIRSSMRKPD